MILMLLNKFITWYAGLYRDIKVNSKQLYKYY